MVLASPKNVRHSSRVVLAFFPEGLQPLAGVLIAATPPEEGPHRNPPIPEGSHRAIVSPVDSGAGGSAFSRSLQTSRDFDRTPAIKSHRLNLLRHIGFVYAAVGLASLRGALKRWHLTIGQSLASPRVKVSRIFRVTHTFFPRHAKVRMTDLASLMTVFKRRGGYVVHEQRLRNLVAHSSFLPTRRHRLWSASEPIVLKIP